MRRHVVVEPVPEPDPAVLLDLWRQARGEAGLAPEASERPPADSRVLTALARPDVLAQLARVDGEPAGFVVCSINVFALGTGPELAIEQLWVAPSFRRQGVARALLTAVVAAAERTGSDVVATNVPSTSRDANRFFARLGFGAVTVRRVTKAASLRRRLAPERADTGLHQLLARRRTLRSRGQDVISA